MATDEQQWREFIRQTASLLITGKLTNQHLRNAVANPHIAALAGRYDFGKSVEAACEQLRPAGTGSPALALEVDAANRRFKRFLRDHTESAARSIA